MSAARLNRLGIPFPHFRFWGRAAMMYDSMRIRVEGRRADSAAAPLHISREARRGQVYETHAAFS
jgi:hypothetical protein